MLFLTQPLGFSCKPFAFLLNFTVTDLAELKKGLTLISPLKYRKVRCFIVALYHSPKYIRFGRSSRCTGLQCEMSQASACAEGARRMCACSTRVAVLGRHRRERALTPRYRFGSVAFELAVGSDESKGWV